MNAYSWPNPSISGTAHAQCAEGLHFNYPRRACTARVTVVRSVCLSVTLHLTSRVFVRLLNGQ